MSLWEGEGWDMGTWTWEIQCEMWFLDYGGGMGLIVEVDSLPIALDDLTG